MRNKTITLNSKSFLYLFLLALINVSGCAGIRGAAAKSNYIKAEAQNHVYETSLVKLWPEVRSYLFEAGYVTRTTDDSQLVLLETDWKDEVAHGAQAGSSRILVQGIDLDGDRSQLVFKKQSKSAEGSMGVSRAWKMEWTLIQRIEPEEANQIEAQANAAGEQAKAG